MVFLSNQIINEYANIGFGTVKNQWVLSFYFHSCIDTGDQPLCGSLFISGASVELPAAEQTGNLLELQGRIQLTWVDTVILNCVCIPYNLDMFESRYCMIHSILYILRKRTGHTADIHFVGVDTFRFNEYLMAVLVGKFNDFVLDRRTVARTGSLNHSGKQWRTAQIIPNDLMCLFICIS